MKTIKRKLCVICEKDVEKVYTFENFPIFMGVTDKPEETDIREDMTFGKCTSCGCVQLTELIPLEILYGEQHNAAIGKTWDRHHYEFYEFIREYVSGNVVEIGGGNLKLAKHLEKEKSVEKVTVYDPNQYEEYKSDKVESVRGIFDPNKVAYDVDIIVHSHLMEHLYNPVEEMKNISSLLSDGAYMGIAVPLVDVMLGDNFTNAMNFEHTYMIGCRMIEDILNSAKLEIIKTKNFSPYAAFIIAKKNKKLEKDDSFLYHGNIHILNNFLDYYNKEVEIIHSKINSGKEETFIFGAHIFTQYLFGFGLDENKFVNILDNDPAKRGKRLYGTSLSVKSPKILRDIKNPLVLLKAAQYTEEIKKDILENINPNTRFIL